MMRRTFRSFPGAAVRAVALVAAALAPWGLQAASVSAQLGKLSRQLAEEPSETAAQSLRTYAEKASAGQRALAWYALGMAEYNAEDYGAAEKTLAQALGGGGDLNEYVAYYHARCIVLAEDHARALGPLERFGRDYPDSRFRPAAERLRAESLLRLKRLEEARSLLARKDGPLEEPVRLYLAGRVEHVAGNFQRAVSLYRETYYHYPFSDQAEVAEPHLDALRRSLGDAYPPAPAKWRLRRANLLYDRRDYGKASEEYARALGAGLPGTDREIALLRKGVADGARGRTAQAYADLARFRPRNADIAAERLYRLCVLERRQGLVRPMLDSVEKLRISYARSRWYEEALLWVGNYYYLRDDREQYPRWFLRLTQAFPQGKHASYAHWKVCWRAWLDDSPRRGELLAEHVKRYPAGPTASGAVYWLGRLREKEGRGAAAQALYRVVTERFPHYYYAFLARERLGGAAGDKAALSAAARELRDALPPPRRLARELKPATRARLERGDLLAALGFGDDAVQELRLVDYRAADSHFAGARLGKLHSARAEPHLAMRALKRYAFGYLRMPLDALSRESWRYLFPLGWEARLRSRSERHGLDPYLVASLIRQESEFDPRAKSRAGALGLMQIMPQTARGLFRRLGIPGFSTRKLLQPDVSLRLGTFHLKEVLARFEGQLEKALAGYNAGERRIPQWMELGPFDEPAEFVETIPFTETRGYVQAIMRNRAMYASLYGG